MEMMEVNKEHCQPAGRRQPWPVGTERGNLGEVQRESLSRGERNRQRQVDIDRERGSYTQRQSERKRTRRGRQRQRDRQICLQQGRSMTGRQRQIGRQKDRERERARGVTGRRRLDKVTNIYLQSTAVLTTPSPGQWSGRPCPAVSTQAPIQIPY